ncbi:BTAD domain-containing putative transcriptional regulator [Kitasatospora sp. NPDC006697]|uniref:AfsR/SARP family transcriptional regulator n=1 Tax=Kitasatospora sp. NPDC006697 TaxID=3364020 RepID=UPI0036C8A450
MQFGLLGPVTADTGEGPATIGAPKQRVVLAALLLEAGRVVSTERLTELLWQGRPPATARTALQNHVMRLRAALGPAGERILTRGPGYLIELRAGELDLERFLALGERGAQALAAGRPAEARDLLGRALELWRDEPLLDVDCAELRATAAGRLADCRTRVLADRIDADLALGQHLAVLPELRAAIGDRPLDERPHRQLMLALYRAGRQAEALAVHRELRAVLVAELGIEPGPEIAELQQRILCADPELLAVPAPPAAPPAAPAEPVLPAPPARRRPQFAAVPLTGVLIAGAAVLQADAGRHPRPAVTAAAAAHVRYVARTGSDEQVLSSTAVDVPVLVPVRAGDTLVVSLMLTSTDPGPVTVTDSAGDAYAPVADVTDPTGHRTMLLAAFGVRALGTADRITAGYPRASKYHIAVDEFSGVSAAAGRAAAFADPGSAPTAFSTSATPVACGPGDLLVAAVGSNSGPAPQFVAGWRSLPVLKLSSYRLSTAYRLAGAAEPDRCAATGTTTAQWEAALAVLR